MTDPRYTAVCLLVDRSGSMQSLKGAAEDVINEFVAGQAAVADRRVTVRVVQFDASTSGGMLTTDPEPDWYLVHCPSTPAADVPKFVLHPRGMTALYDAMIRTIDEFGAELGAMPEDQRPGTVIFATYTDGLENASNAKADDVRQKVEHQINVYRWHVVYLGANQDAVMEGEKMGVPQASSMTYDASDEGTRSAGNSFESYAVAASSGGEAAFTQEDRQKAMQSSKSKRRNGKRGGSSG